MSRKDLLCANKKPPNLLLTAQAVFILEQQADVVLKIELVMGY